MKRRAPLTTDRVFHLGNLVWRTPPLDLDAALRFGSGRDAVYRLLEHLASQGQRRRILLPGFHPEGLLAPAQRAGWEVACYPLNEWLDPDPASLCRLLETFRPGLAVFIHYFGLFKERRGFVDLCREHGARVLEDFAQGWIEPSALHALEPGSDYQLFSLPKLFPVPDGGVLRAAPGASLPPRGRPSARHARFVAQEFAGLLFRSLARLPAQPSLARKVFVRLANRCQSSSYDLLMRRFTEGCCVSRLTRWLWRHLDVPGMAARRRHHARLYRDGLTSPHARHFPAEQVGPLAMMGYPIIVRRREPVLEHHWFRAARPPGQGASPEWSATESHLLLPCGETLSDGDIARVIRCLNAPAEGPGDLPERG